MEFNLKHINKIPQLLQSSEARQRKYGLLFSYGCEFVCWLYLFFCLFCIVSNLTALFYFQWCDSSTAVSELTVFKTKYWPWLYYGCPDWTAHTAGTPGAPGSWPILHGFNEKPKKLILINNKHYCIAANTYCVWDIQYAFTNGPKWKIKLWQVYMFSICLQVRL